VHRIAILEPTTLLGRELKEHLERHPELVRDLRLLTSDEEDFGTLTEVAGAAALVARADAEALADLDLIFVCGDLAPSRRVLERLPEGATAILLSPDATLAEGRPAVTGINPEVLERGATLLSPQPAAVLLSHLLHALADLVPLQAAATVIQPVSVYGDPGVDELLEQSRQILAMAGPPSGGLFGGQLAFNVLPGAVDSQGVAGQVRQVLDASWPLAVEVLQGAVFHGMTASLWIELGGSTDPRVVEDALLISPWVERAEEPDSLGPVVSATESRILLGGVRADGGRPGGFWIRTVMDNLTRGGALNALELAATVLS